MQSLVNFPAAEVPIITFSAAEILPVTFPTAGIPIITFPTGLWPNFLTLNLLIPIQFCFCATPKPLKGLHSGCAAPKLKKKPVVFQFFN